MIPHICSAPSLAFFRNAKKAHVLYDAMHKKCEVEGKPEKNISEYFHICLISKIYTESFYQSGIVFTLKSPSFSLGHLQIVYRKMLIELRKNNLVFVHVLTTSSRVGEKHFRTKLEQSVGYFRLKKYF